MKIREIYLGKGIPVVSLTIAILCIVTTVISQLVPSAKVSYKDKMYRIIRTYKNRSGMLELTCCEVE